MPTKQDRSNSYYEARMKAKAPTVLKGENDHRPHPWRPTFVSSIQQLLLLTVCPTTIRTTWWLRSPQPTRIGAPPVSLRQCSLRFRQRNDQQFSGNYNLSRWPPMPSAATWIA